MRRIGPLGPPFSEKLFPVCRVGQSGGRDFFVFPPFILYKLGYTENKPTNDFFKFETFQLALLIPVGR